MGAHHHPHRLPPFEAPVVTLDGEVIPAAEIAAEMQHHRAGSGQDAWHAAAEAVVLGRLLRREARAQGIEAAPEQGETAEDAQLRGLLDSAVTVPEADEATCRRWYDANRSRFRTRASWRAAHVLFAADPGDEAERRDARRRAEEALAELRAAPDHLATLAQRFSACPSRDQGGDLGEVEEGSTVPEFEAALRATLAGAIHDGVVETRYGFHLLRVDAHRPAQPVPFADAQARIAAHLHGTAWRRAARQYMAMLASRATIEGLVLSASADGPLVQ